MKLGQLKHKFFKSLPGIRNSLYDQLVEHGYYLHRPDKVTRHWQWSALGVLLVGAFAASVSLEQTWLWASTAALVIGTVLSAAVLGGFSLIMPARTVPGARAGEATLGFREFLSRVESDRYRRMITSPEMFERYLPHAMAFGVEEKWARAFENIDREPPQWYTGSGRGAFSVSNFSSRMSALSQTASKTMSSRLHPVLGAVGSVAVAAGAGEAGDSRLALQPNGGFPGRL